MRYSQSLRCRLNDKVTGCHGSVRVCPLGYSNIPIGKDDRLFCGLQRTDDVRSNVRRVESGRDCCYDMFLSHLRGDAYKSRSTPPLLSITGCPPSFPGRPPTPSCTDAGGLELSQFLNYTLSLPPTSSLWNQQEHSPPSPSLGHPTTSLSSWSPSSSYTPSRVRYTISFCPP